MDKIYKILQTGSKEKDLHFRDNGLIIINVVYAINL